MLSSTTLSNTLKGKKGAASTLRDKDDSCVEYLPKIRALNPYWYYCWGPEPIATNQAINVHAQGRILDVDEQPVIDFIPMFWGYYPENFTSALKKVVRRRPVMILGFNEPDKVDQSNLPDHTALEAWSILQKVVDTNEANEHRKIVLVSPSCSNPLGSWMTTFMEGTYTNDLRVDVVGVHYYGSPNVEAFQNRMQMIHERYGRRPLLITELGIADWEAKSVEQNRFKPASVLLFMQMVLPWMEEQDWILGYNWFPFKIDNPHGTSSALFDQNNHLTALGSYYASWVGPRTSIAMDIDIT
jgi:hypothetical protein